MKNAIFTCLLLVMAAAADAAIFEFDISPPGTSAGTGLSPQNEIIFTPSSGSGNEISTGILFDTTTRMLTLNLGYGSAFGFTDLTGPGFSWLLHGPASPSETAPVVFDLAPLHAFAPNPAQGGIILGMLTLTPGQTSDLIAGLDYINIYTPASLGGEIRGQLVVVPEPGSLGLFAMTALALGVAFHRRKKQ